MSNGVTLMCSFSFDVGRQLFMLSVVDITTSLDMGRSCMVVLLSSILVLFGMGGRLLMVQDGFCMVTLLSCVLFSFDVGGQLFMLSVIDITAPLDMGRSCMVVLLSSILVSFGMSGGLLMVPRWLLHGDMGGQLSVMDTTTLLDISSL